MNEEWIEGFPSSLPERRRRIDVVLPSYYYPIVGTLLSHRLFVRWRHFDPKTKRPYLCPDVGNCPACLSQKTTYATGWMSGCSDRSFLPIIFHLSELALKDLATYAERHVIGRGLILKTTRQDTRPNAAMHAQILGRDEREGIPEDFDPRDTLERMWGVAAAKNLTEHRLGRAGLVVPGPRPLAEGGGA